MTDQHFGGIAGGLHRIGAAVVNRLGGKEARWRVALAPWVGHGLNALTLGRGIETEINGARFRIDPRHRLFLQPDYESPVADYLRDRVRAGDCCLDVGAHIGAYALQMARWSAPGGRVVAFEPNPGTADVLRRHLRMNGLSDIVRVEELGVSAEEGVADFAGAAASGLSRLGTANPELAPADVTTMPIRLVTLDRYCAAQQIVPDCVVIDVEGYEFSVLQGALSVIRQRGAALVIVAEMHPSIWALSGWSREAGEAVLRTLGRRPVGLTGQRDPLAEYGSVALV